MNRKYLLTAIVGMMTLAFTSCDQKLTRKYGFSTTVKLPKGQKLIEATWKENSLWYLTEPMDSDYVPKKKIFQESSEYGVIEGKVTFIERR